MLRRLRGLLDRRFATSALATLVALCLSQALVGGEFQCGVEVGMMAGACLVVALWPST